MYFPPNLVGLKMSELTLAYAVAAIVSLNSELRLRSLLWTHTSCGYRRVVYARCSGASHESLVVYVSLAPLPQACVMISYLRSSLGASRHHCCGLYSVVLKITRRTSNGLDRKAWQKASLQGGNGHRSNVRISLPQRCSSPLPGPRALCLKISERCWIGLLYGEAYALMNS